ncbi:MAG: ABC transporter ATP-binding protein [Armatimonadetes bacterium CG_4_10_14_3_um_filter_66_18]|nr:ABC transporter ATP-binding protein [Armatimonadota bacterium]PIW13369.1 MAG: ABC transporter ATP-binding protein [Armatimonadetes bacterium CG17_big_fil_post_rev_8_21_14_2_50_66_6]PIX37867.1 MAG: ABC transporter ATP-binding protein [Armatimonadetes bacterium CG_4_8_14_3_um_filter_66_20]PIY47170.1 MAG: ABC transporter ATP-binding protein [Armatimonadetes bacterium CG_4_10_14_3_um_filter_66_18]PIZ49717.1 MAG: ABC transporter ATP-binding protein [Armatimonadetes bacterium CG_4_10_14_0_8_um_fil
MIRLEAVSKRFRLRGREVTGLDAAELHIEDGEFVAVVGSSGSGKSTLLLTLGGLSRPDTGSVHLNGYSLYDLSLPDRARARRETIGFLFQTFNLVPYLTALENVQVPLYLAGRSLAEQEQETRRLLEEVGLGDRLDHKPAELSVGQQQRVALVRALANKPKLLLADEPTGSLDPARAEELMAQLKRLNEEGLTIVMVTHDLSVAARATRHLRMELGRISEENTK